MPQSSQIFEGVAISEVLMMAVDTVVFGRFSVNMPIDLSQELLQSDVAL
jgi:hypothetical protein